VPFGPHDGQGLERASFLKAPKMTVLSVQPLDETTWPDFAQLIERHNGVWGGCWCMAFHPEGVSRTKTAAHNRFTFYIREDFLRFSSKGYNPAHA
jgi:hypothetical protein